MSGEAAAVKELRSAMRRVGVEGQTRFPWRRRPSRYRTLIAEVLLQHTPAERVAPVFDQLVRRWPTFATLAIADQAAIEATLAPLGLQRRRAAALRNAARVIESEWSPSVTWDAQQLAHLPGVGPYTAGVVAAVASEIPTAVADGGIARLLARYFGFDLPAQGARSQLVRSYASSLEASEAPREDMWGLIDIARDYCKARPRCSDCPARTGCLYAFDVNRDGISR